MTDTTLILNVDDNEAARYAKSRILTRAGFKVIEASCGIDAIAKSRSERPQLILLDVKLPDINGFEVCRRIKEDPATNTILVLQTSASFVGTTDKIRALEGGADNYLVEPIEPEELVANVKALLRLGQAENRLRESERRFRQIAENVSDVFWIFTSGDNRLLYVSPAYETMWGRSATRLDEDMNDWLEAVHPDDRTRVETAFLRLHASGIFEEEYRILHPDGDVRWVRDRGFPVRSDRSEDHRVARISQDITDKKNAETKLQEADRRKDEFLATLAHELRNPLGPIRNSVELMSLLAPHASEAEQRAREIILRQTDHLVRLVDDLLDISRITEGKVTLRPRPVELHEFVQPALETAHAVIDARRHHLSVTLPDHEVWVSGDAVRLAQIIGNLLHNASKFTPAGGEISLHAAINNDVLSIRVQDNGIGIDPLRAPHIFDLFVQAGHAPDRAQEGLGIGLSLVRKLVDLHGGKVAVSSAGIGQGSVFEIVLPILPSSSQEEKSGADASAARKSLPERTGRRVLVVDDNTDAAQMLAELIRTYGHECMVAHEGADAIEMATCFLPDIVFLDIGLPGMSGYQVAQAMRKQDALADTVLVALTGYGQPQDKQNAIEAGFDHHLVKPIRLDALSSLGLIPSPSPASVPAGLA